VRGQQGRDVHVSHAVAVGHAEGLAGDVLRHPLQAAAGHGGRAGVDQGHAPVLGAAIVDGQLVLSQVDRHVRLVQEVVGEIFLDHVALVTKAHHELAHAVLGVALHDVPEDRLAADFHHGLGADFGLFGQPRA
jgi:hypothetical protein